MTNLPKRGDLVIGTKGTGAKVLFVRQDSISAASDIDTSVYEVIGVVVKRKGKKVLIAYKEHADKPWSARWSYRLTGYTLDGASHTGVLSIRQDSDSWAENHNYTIAYSASTKAELVTQLNSYFASNEPFTTQDWYAHIDDDGEITISFDYVTWSQVYAYGTSGFTTQENLLPGAVAHADMRRRNGAGGGEGAISSWYRALAYYRASTGTNRYEGNLGANETSVRQGYPINLTNWLGQSADGQDHCAALRAIFGEGEAGWLEFMKSCLPVNPTDYGDMGITDGLERTKYLAQQRYSSNSKTNQPVCPAAEYCYNIATDAIPQGKWFLGTTRDIADLLEDISYPSHGDVNSDPINATLNKVVGTNISNASDLWSCCRYGGNSAWFAYGNCGFFGDYNLGNWFTCVPFSLYELA